MVISGSKDMAALRSCMLTQQIVCKAAALHFNEMTHNDSICWSHLLVLHF